MTTRSPRKRNHAKTKVPKGLWTPKIVGNSREASKETPEGPEDPEKLWLKYAEGRVVKASDAYRCCKGGKLGAEEIIYTVKDKIIEIAAWNKKKKAAGPIEPSPKKTHSKNPPPRALPAAAIVVEIAPPLVSSVLARVALISSLGGMLSGWGVKTQTVGDPVPKVEALSDGWTDIDAAGAAQAGLALDLAAELINKTMKECELCVARKMLGQKTPRQNVMTLDEKIIRRRSPGGSKP